MLYRSRLRLWQLLSLLCLIIATSHSQSTLHGTTVVVIQKKDTILVGAESKQHFRAPRSPDAPSARDKAVEKIRLAGNMGFVIGGIYKQWNRSDSLIFDAYKIAEFSCRGNQTIFEKISSFDRNVKRPLERAWKELLNQNPAADLSRYNLDFVAFCFQESKPVVVIHSFRPKPNPGLLMSPITGNQFDPQSTIDTLRFPQPTLHDPAPYTVSSSTVDEAMFASIRSLTRLSSVTYIKKVIQRAISIDSVYNGLPIRILCITPRKMDWIN
jgi:hypothetical protein